MSEQSNESAAVEEESVESGTEAESKQNLIQLDLDDLTQEGREKAEKDLKRKIEDMPYTVEGREARAGSLRVMTFVLERDTYKNEEKRMLSDLNKEIALPGFRKGKAPLNLLRRRLGEEVVKESVTSVSTNVLRQEVASGELKLLSKPSVTSYDLEHQDGQKVSLEIEVELEPVVELKGYKGIEVEVEEGEAGDDRLNDRLEELRRYNAAVESLGKNAKLKEGDQVTVDVVVASSKGERLDHLCGSDREYRNYMKQLPPELAEKLTGARIGDMVEADIENKATNRKGEEIIHTDHHEITVKDIKREKLPELDDEFAKDLGDHETLDALKDEIRKELKAGEENRRKAEAVRALWEKVGELNPVDVPKSLKAQAQYNMIMQDSYQLQRMGLSLDQVVQDSDKYLTDQRSGAEQNVKIELLRSRLGEIENLGVTDVEVDAEIERIAAETDRKPLAVRARLEADKELDDFRENLANNKVNDFLFENNTIKFVPPKKEEKTDREPSVEK
jgi:trigger factor